MVFSHCVLICHKFVNNERIYFVTADNCFLAVYLYTYVYYAQSLTVKMYSLFNRTDKSPVQLQNLSSRIGSNNKRLPGPECGPGEAQGLGEEMVKVVEGAVGATQSRTGSPPPLGLLE